MPIRAAISISKPFVVPKLPTSGETKKRLGKLNALMKPSSRLPARGSKMADGWVAIQDFRVEIHMLLQSNSLI